ncbi:hypothetical protein [Vibrio sp. NH-UV-68]|uniref:hypothetical protein n=1 Tax=unclassified Vibrio TaxID=2614977 RepID=UPI0036F28A1B
MNKYNKAFKSDSQRLAFSLRSSIAKRRSHLNAALVASGKNVAKAESLRRLNCAILFSFVIWCSLLKSCAILMLWFRFAVSGANLLVESQLCGIVFPKGLLGIFGQFSATL